MSIAKLMYNCPGRDNNLWHDIKGMDAFGFEHRTSPPMVSKKKYKRKSDDRFDHRVPKRKHKKEETNKYKG